MSLDLKELEAKLEANTSLLQAAADLVTGVANHLDELSHDPVAIGAKAAELREHAAALAAAVVANTHEGSHAASVPLPADEPPAVDVDEEESAPKAPSVSKPAPAPSSRTPQGRHGGHGKGH